MVSTPLALEKDHAGRSLDQREVGERLREVPQLAPCLRVVFLGIEAKERGNCSSRFIRSPAPLHLSHRSWAKQAGLRLRLNGPTHESFCGDRVRPSGSDQDMPDPKLGAGKVLVRVAGIGINPEDMLERNGDMKDRYRSAGCRFQQQRRRCAGGLPRVQSTSLA